MIEAAVILLGAFALDILLGDPVYSLHPVRLIGRTASLYEGALFRGGLTGYAGGVVFFILTVITITGIYAAAHLGIEAGLGEIVRAADVFILYSCIALKDQFHHARPVRRALEKGELDAARAAVQKIVGRDASVLDPRGVARAAVESIAESFTDGFFSPVFWFVLGAACAALLGADPVFSGVAAALFYRAVNTLDSMVGYRNERYRKFGCCSAVSDDVFNYIPARLSVFFLFVAALVLGFSAQKGLKAWLRDKSKSSSPNSAHTESFAAGALGIRLGGPVTYFFGTVDKPLLGFGGQEISPRHIEQCLKLVFAAGAICIFASAAALFVAGFVLDFGF